MVALVVANAGGQEGTWCKLMVQLHGGGGGTGLINNWWLVEKDGHQKVLVVDQVSDFGYPV